MWNGIKFEKIIFLFKAVQYIKKKKKFFKQLAC